MIGLTGHFRQVLMVLTSHQSDGVRSDRSLQAGVDGSDRSPHTGVYSWSLHAGGDGSDRSLQPGGDRSDR